MKQLTFIILLLTIFSSCKKEDNEDLIIQYSDKYDIISNHCGDLIFIDSAVGYLITGDKETGEPFGNELLKTEDGGKNWQPLASIPHHKNGQIKKASFLNSQVGIILVSGMTPNYSRRRLVYKTENGGKSWDLIFNISGMRYSGIYLISETEMIFGGYSVNSENFEIYKSFDSGKTWNRESPIEINYINPNPDFQFLTKNLGFVWLGHFLYKTVDGGKNWHVIYEIGEFEGHFQFANKKQGVILTADASWNTQDGGNSWQEIQSQFKIKRPNKLISSSPIQNDLWFFLSHDDEILKSMDGGRTIELVFDDVIEDDKCYETDIISLHMFDEMNGIVSGMSNCSDHYLEDKEINEQEYRECKMASTKSGWQ